MASLAVLRPRARRRDAAGHAEPSREPLRVAPPRPVARLAPSKKPTVQGQPDQVMRRSGDREGGEDHAADGQRTIGRRLALNSRQLMATPAE